MTFAHGFVSGLLLYGGLASIALAVLPRYPWARRYAFPLGLAIGLAVQLVLAWLRTQ